MFKKRTSIWCKTGWAPALWGASLLQDPRSWMAARALSTALLHRKVRASPLVHPLLV